MNYGFIIDNRKCIGCHACTVACKAEHDTALGANRTWVKYIEKGEFPNTHRAFSVMRCNHCADSPCTEICPTTALFTRADGIVDFDNRRCIGCKACMQACPYDAIHIDPHNGTAAKCNYCAHRVEVSLEPPCVNVCPTHAIISGDLDNNESEISTLLALHPVQVRKPEKGTDPKLYYIEGDAASLIPGATGGEQEYMWSDAPPQGVDFDAWRLAVRRHEEEQQAYVAGSEGARKVYAAAEPHRGSWGRSVSAYLFTKSIAAGLMLLMVPLLLAGANISALGFVQTSVAALVLLGLTNFLLVYKLERRDRFFYVLTKPQWRSWLTRGAYIMMAYGLLLSAGAVVAVSGRPIPAVMALLSAIAAFGTAVYSAFLFNQAKGRDLWQSALLPLHLIIQATVAGAAGLLLLDAPFDTVVGVEPTIERVLSAGLGLNLLALGAEFFSKHTTEDARVAAHLIVSGAFARRFWVVVFFAGNLLPIVLLLVGQPILASLLALIGLAVFEDLFVRAGQAIPLA